ncbi:hypothetical protein [Dyella choica]|uniref:Uncharacterized protein n=1 Tax=Dyella choica TaxID=1927959 RepID=A0A432M842_9GAMM|nr:hypothetical protein [Dyella choica]RUL77711.1 hypothetical protein EKH80_07525 [Dyella choica]
MVLLLPVLVQACDFTPVPIVGSVGKVGQVSVSFGEADDVKHPAAWQGPLQISVDGAPQCSVSEDVSIVEEPVMLAGDVLYVPTYSGSNNRLYAVDVKTCKVIWRSVNFSGKTVLKQGRLVAGKSGIAVDKRCRPLGSGNK